MAPERGGRPGAMAATVQTAEGLFSLSPDWSALGEHFAPKRIRGRTLGECALIRRGER